MAWSLTNLFRRRFLRPALRKPIRRHRRPTLERLEDRVVPDAVPILSGHYDNLLTGWNSKETALTPATVNDAGFGKLFNYQLDGYAYAQPLYVPNLTIPGTGGGTYNVVFVATEHDSLYAFNADAKTGGKNNDGLLWQRSFIDPANGITTMPSAETFSGDIVPEIGITGTPVIDAATNTLYVIAKTKEVRSADSNNAHYVQKLYAIDITTGNNRASNGVVTIGDTAYQRNADGSASNNFVSDTTSISVAGTGAGSVNGVLNFNARKENDRMSLQLVPAAGGGKTVYLAYASHGDNGPYHGWVIGYDASTLALQKVFNTSPNGSASGIWESGGNLGFDAQGNLYFATGNGFVSGGNQGFNFNSGGPTALGAGGGGLGYQGIGNSLAVTFRAFDGAANSSTGLGLNGLFAPGNAPTVNPTGGGATGGSLAAGTYYAEYTFVTASGAETTASPESAQFTVAAGNVPRVTLPALPSGFSSINLYLTPANGAKGSEVRYATGITTATYDLTAANTGTVKPPATNALGGTTGIDFNAGAQAATPHTFQVTLTYSGTTLTETVKDLTTNSTPVTFTYNNVNLQQLVGGSTAYVGFTGGTGGLNVEQDIKSWTFGPTVGTPTIDHSAGFANAGDLTANGGSSLPTYTAISPVGIFQYHQDLGIPGDPTPAGTASYNSALNGGTYTLTASGTDIGFKANQYDTDTDRMQFVYNAVSGTSGEIIARVNTLSNTDFWTKAVVQIRQSLDPQAANVSSILSPHNVSEITWRDKPPDIDNAGNQAPGLTGATERATGTGPIPGWIRLVRDGNKFTSYWAADTVDASGNHAPGPWQGELSHTTNMTGDVYVGIGLSAHANGKTATATFDHVTVTGFTTRTQDPVAILTPAANTQAGSIFSNNKVDISSFTTTFTVQMKAGTNPIADGMTFTIQAAARGTEISESVLKLSTTGSGTSLPVTDYFTPHDWKLLDNNDSDLGSGGTLLLPDAVGSTAHPHLIIETGKTGRLYLIDRDNMGQFNTRYDHIVQVVTLAGTGTTPGVWGNPAFFQDGPNTGIIYYWGSSSPGLAFRITNGVIDPTPLSKTAVTFGFPGAQPSISSNGTTGSTGIMWALRDDNFGSVGPESLYAYSAEDLTKLLWKSDDLASPAPGQLGRDAIGGSSVKFVFPIVTNGHVYAGSNGSLAVYGLLPAHAAAPSVPTNFQVAQVAPIDGGDTRLKLTWTNPAAPNDATYISVLRATSAAGPFTEIARVGADQSSFIDTGLTPLTRYWYEIQAVNQAGSSAVTASQNNITRLPGSKLGVTNVTSAEVDLSWTVVGTDATYNLERSTDPTFATFTNVASNLSHTTTTFADTTVVRPNTYYYRVHAFNTTPLDESFSNVVAPVVAPVDVEFPFPDGIQNANGLQLNGSALFSPDEHILRLNNDFNQAGSVFTTNKVSDTKWTTTFWVRLHEGTQPNPADGFTFTLQANSPTALGTGGGELGYTGVANSVAIKFDVFQNGGETSPNSTGLYVNGAAPHGAANGTTIFDLNPNVVNLRDQHRKRIDIDYDVATLKLHVKITDEQHDGGPTSVEQTYIIDIPKTIGSDGVYAGFTGGTGGSYSLQDILGWVFPQTVPAGPSNLQAAPGSSNDVTLTWKLNSTNENGFAIERSLDNYHFTQIDQVGLGVNTYHDTGLTTNTAYFYRVLAFNDLGNSAYSNTVQTAVGASVVTIDHSDGFASNSDLQKNGSATFFNPAPASGTIGIFTATQNIGTGNPLDNPPANSGSATFSNGTYTLTAQGSDIWDSDDHFRYLYKPWTTAANNIKDGEIIARVVSENNTDFWTKAGIMIRKDLTSGSPNAFTLETGPNNINNAGAHNEPVFQWRDNAGGGSGDTGNHVNNIQAAPVWLRLVRSGNTFSGYWAADINNGQSHGPWNVIGNTHTVPGIGANDDVLVGLALTAHNNGTTASATFDHVQVITSALIIDGGGGEAGSIFKKDPVPVTGTFSTSFVMNVRSVSGSADGLTFVLQADSRGASALGDAGGGVGYTGISPSVGILFDLYSNGTHQSQTGLLLNGVKANGSNIDMTSAGIDFRQNHTYQVDLNYDGFFLNESVKDLVSGKVFTQSYLLDLRGKLGKDTAYVGFTGGTGGETAWAAIESWTANFNSVVAPIHIETKFPAAAASGAPQAFTVAVKTAAGQTLTNYTGTIRFASSDPNAILPDDYTFTTGAVGDNGTHTFAGVLFTVGPETISATDVATIGTSFVLTDAPTVQVTPRSFVVTDFPSPTTAGDEHTITVTAQDYFKNTATGYLGTVHFTSDDPQAALPPDYTFTAGDAGVHVFSVTLKTAGIRSITVADTQTPSASKGTESGIEVDPAALSTFVVSGFPTTTTAGDVHTFTVTAKDAFGNTVTGYTGTVHFTSDDTKAGLPDDFTFTGSEGGVATFSASLNSAGTHAITVTDVNAGVSGTQSGILVKAGKAVGFVLDGLQSSVVADQPQPVIVYAVDAFGNRATDYTGTVHFSSSDDTAVLPANYTFTTGANGDNGFHMFLVTFKKRGTQSLTVTDTADGTILGTIDNIDVE